MPKPRLWNDDRLVGWDEGTHDHGDNDALAGSRLLIALASMMCAVERAKSTYDLVVIDTPPLTAVSADGGFSSEDLAPTRSAF
jgi:hypothetical protein